MQPIVFCNRCRGMHVGWNRRYAFHRLICTEWISQSSKLLILTVFIAMLLFAFPTPSSFFVFSVDRPQPRPEGQFVGPVLEVVDPAVQTVSGFLKRYDVDETHRHRVSEAIVASAKKHNLEPRLIASIMIVESRANPFAISHKDSIGIMQVHVPTWGQTAEREGINLFNIEDNVDFGARILKNYVRQSGVWDGVKRYRGWLPDNPESEQEALNYVGTVQRIYGLEAPATAALIQEAN